MTRQSLRPTLSALAANLALAAAAGPDATTTLSSTCEIDWIAAHALDEGEGA